MPRPLQRVVVLGAGTMGARLAAHCANHGLEATLLDVDGAAARRGLEAAAKGKPAAFFLPTLAERVLTGGLDGHEAALRRADWVVEAIVENLEAKRALLARIASLLRPDAVITTNTSGLPVASVGEGLPAALRGRWFGTHFFNPPRYMRLVEMIPTAESDREAMAWLQGELELRLGKGVVAARDTPNFIANRIGVFALMNTLRLMGEYKLTVDQVDALTGPAMGWPKSATFRTLDLIGLDTLAHVVRNSHANLGSDERRELFVLPPYIEEMIGRGWLGEKSGQGFYKREGDAILTLDLDTLSYRPRQKSEPDMQSPFLRAALDGLYAYCERRLGEITDEPAAMDQAMRWGYNWERGPFEMQAWERAGRPKKELRSNLRELGDGVGLIELQGKMNVIGAEAVRLVQETLAEGRFEAYVLHAAGENFSVGADLLYLLALIQGEEWDEAEAAVRGFQAMTQAVKFSPRPVVVAPFGMALGGGCELTLHAAQVVAHAELYSGLVGVGVGLIPAGGGTKEMALRMDAKAAFETIALAKVSTSAAEARQLRYLRRGDEIVANRDRLLEAARQRARQIANAGYEPQPEQSLTAPGPSVQSTLELGVYLMKEAGRISDYDQLIAKRLIHVICAGGAPAGMPVPESRLLDLEREAFLSLCGEPKTRERVSYMLKTGKALRN